MRRSRFLLFLALALAVMLAASFVLADTIEYNLNVSSADIIRDADVIRVYNRSKYYLANADGTALSERYSSMSSGSYGLFTVKNSSGTGEGVIDVTGKVIIPATYTDADIVSERWTLGIRTKKTTEQSGDYYTTDSSGKKTYSLIDAVDVYYMGVKVGSVGRGEYQYAYAHGDYIFFRNRDTNTYTCYSKDFVPSPYKLDYSSEYDSQYQNGKTSYYHQGSGQQAFVPGCTLTADEVEKCYMVEKGVIYDLQGNVVSKLKQNYDSISSTLSGRYAEVRLYGKSGIIEIATGEEVIPLEYDSIESWCLDDETGKLYAIVVKDGKVGCVCSDGRVTCEVVYAKSAVTIRGMFGYLKDLTGGIIVLSAKAGILPEKYKEVEISYGVNNAFVATREDGTCGVIGINGEELIPFGNYSSYGLGVNDAGTVIVAPKGSSSYSVWTLDPNTASHMSDDDPVDEAETVDDGSWTCSNGHSGNTGKFCPECGEPRPVPSVCANCGYDFHGNVTKFCPECGTPTGK